MDMNFTRKNLSPGWSALGAVAALVAALLIFGIEVAGAAPEPQSPEEGRAIFERNCRTCHTIGGGPLIGPDLEGVVQRRDRAWLAEFIMAPDRLIAEGDPIAVQLLQEYNQVPMPNLGLSQQEVDSVLMFLAGGAQTDAQPVALLDGASAQRGEALFTGAQPLANGGTACLACHSVAGATAFGGGSLGPDLTHVIQRYGDAGLQSALQGLPFPTMQGIFAQNSLTPQEQADLFAYFEQSDQQPASSQVSAPVWFWGTGVLGALLLFGGMLIFWPRQRRSLSERLRARR